LDNSWIKFKCLKSVFYSVRRFFYARFAGNIGSLKRKRKLIAKKRKHPASKIKLSYVTERLPTRVVSKRNTKISRGTKVRRRAGESPEELIRRFKKASKSYRLPRLKR